MLNPSYPTGAPTGNAYVDALIWGGSLASGTGATSSIKVAIGGGESVYGVLTETWTASRLDALKSALHSWENVANIQFSYVANPDLADLEYFLVSGSAMGWLTGDEGMLGFHEIPDGSVGAPLYGFFNEDGYGWDSAGLKPGGYGYITLMHEIGHGLGLAHPHDGGSADDASVFPGVTAEFDDYGDFELNQGIWTTMSYNDGWNLYPASSSAFGYQGTPMALDIAAIQAIYGANMNYHTGADTYTLPKVNGSGSYWSCIWDAGGSDSISNQGAKLACVIDLRAATLSGEHAGGYVSQASGILGGYTIAYGVTIENARGGVGNDILQGNDADNQLEGGRGDDLILGGTGLDTAAYAYASKAVQVNLASGSASGGGGNDLLIDMENVLGGRAGDTLSGNDGANNISGGRGNDYIYGSGGNDTLIGDAGNDWLFGDSGSDFLFGGAGKDTLAGGDGDDRIAGGAGVDLLNGGLGADIFVFDILNAGDRISDFSAEDTLEFDLDVYSMLAEASLDNWVVGAKALDADDFLIYNASKGILYYDANGSGAGGAKAVVTILGAYAPSLSLDDIAVV